MGIIAASLTMGAGFINYMHGIRNQQELFDQICGHILFVLGAGILLYFLLRGDGFFNGNTSMMVLKTIGFLAGMSATIALIAALSNVEPAADGADVDLGQMVSNSESAFTLCGIFGVVALGFIIFVNCYHNRLVGANPDGPGGYTPFLNGLLNLGLVVSVGAGACIVGDIGI